jgi:hypothetical protein
VWVLADSVRSMFHPWRRLRSLPHIDLSWRRMPGRLGETDGVASIVMHPDQSQVQRRCTIAHELAHVELGHTDGCNDVEEQAARGLAARWLIEIEDLAEAALWARSRSELADELWVDTDTLDARLDHLGAGERRYLRERLAGREPSA